MSDNIVNDKQISMYEDQLLVQISKIIIVMSAIIMLASIIHSYHKYISATEWKVSFVFLEAKAIGLFKPDYQISYPNQHDITIKREITVFLSDPYVDKVINRFGDVLHVGWNLAKALHLIIFSSMLLCLWLREVVVNNNPYPYPKVPQEKISGSSNKLKSALTEEAVQFIKVKNI